MIHLDRNRVFALAITWACAATAGEFTPAVKVALLDLPHCQAYAEGRLLNAAPAAALAGLADAAGPSATPESGWTTGSLPDRWRHFRLAFTEPVAIGTILTVYTSGLSPDVPPQLLPGARVSYLKAGAPYPGDVTNDEQWAFLPVGHVKVLPPGVKTRALRFSDDRAWDQQKLPESVFPPAYILRERYYTPMVWGKAQEIPHPYSNRWIGYWHFSQSPTLAGLFITQNRANSAEIEVLPQAVVQHPLLAEPAQWTTGGQTKGTGGNPFLYPIPTPVPARAVRVSPRGGINFPHNMGEIIPLVNLGTLDEPPVDALPPIPVQVQVPMPLDGFLAMNIYEKPTGRLVRRLVAEVSRKAGPGTEGWDLRDDAGLNVPPGEYEWRAVARPPLKLTYEMTVNHAGQPPWWAPAPGKGGGGWLADHTPPHAVCALNDYLFIGSRVAENGHAIVITDLDGNKRWGTHHLFGSQGVRCWAQDERHVYMVNGGGIMRFDTQNQLAQQPIQLDITYTPEVPGPGSAWGEHISGGAVRDGKLYLAFNVPPPTETPAGGAALYQRISIFKLPAEPATEKAQLIKHLPFPNPGALASAPDGSLYIQSGNRIARLLPDDTTLRAAVPAGLLESPVALACDAAGRLHVVDIGPRNVRIFDTGTGKLVGTVGTPGGAALGKWNATRFTNPAGVTVDKLGRVWVAESDHQPKRVSRWSADGQLQLSLLGPSGYGGGGHLDPRDRRVLNYDGMKFVIDWERRTWTLDSILYRFGLSAPGSNPDRTLYVKDRRYLVGDPRAKTVASINIERDGVAIPLVMAGNLGIWASVDFYPELKTAFGAMNRSEFGFLWQDDNRDGIPQAAEVRISEQHKLTSPYWPSKIGEDLTINFKGVRLRPTGSRDDGTPLYSLDAVETVPLVSDAAWTAADGRTFVLGNKLLAADGTTVLWEYPDQYLSVHGANRASRNRMPGVLVGEHYVVGRIEAAGEELFVTNGNHGDWFAFTRDGLLAACIFGGPAGFGQRSWSMPEWEAGRTDLTDLRLAQEHFGGSIVTADDGRVYAVAGHNHNSVVRVDGLEAMKRMSGVITITRSEIEKTHRWDLQRAALARLDDEPKVATMPFLDTAPTIDGTLYDWPPPPLPLAIPDPSDANSKRPRALMTGALAYDNQNLYIAARVADDSPMLNSAQSAQDRQHLFKFGDALDVLLGTDPKAAPGRLSPVPGDIRLLLSRVDGKPIVMLYHPAAPGVPEKDRGRFTSPVGETIVNRVAELTGARVAIQATADMWIIEAAIPWAEIGIAPPPGNSTLRADMGVIAGDQNGMRTVARHYWATKSQTMVSDLAFEARIYPGLWGEITTQYDDIAIELD